jgi:hypothetical protein
MTTAAELRKQLRWAWSKLGCRCIFDKRDRKIHEDAHCPVHGVYGDPDEMTWLDPFHQPVMSAGSS